MPEETGPWTKYQQPPAANGPWVKYQQASQASAPTPAQAATSTAKDIVNSGVDVAKGFGKELVSLGQAEETAMTLGLNKVIDPKCYAATQRMAEPRNTNQKIGKYGTELAEAFVPIPGVSAIKAAQGAKLVAKMLAGAGREALDVGLRAFGQSGGDVGQAAGGAAVGGVIGAAVPVLGKVLEAGAKSAYGKILHPQGRVAKEVVEAKLLPEQGKGIKGVGSILDQGKTAIGLTRESLAKKFSDKVAAATTEMNQAYASLGPQAKVNLNPILHDLGSFIQKKAILPNGQIADQELYNKGIQYARMLTDKTLANALGQAPIGDVRAFRQIIDDQLYKSKLAINPETAQDTIRNALRTSIQRQIHSEHPSTEAVDAAVHFWKTAAKLMGGASKDEIGNEIYRHGNAVFHAGRIGVSGALGAALGEESGRRNGGVLGGTLGAIAGGIGGVALSEAFASTAWRSASAVAKNKVAQALLDGDLRRASSLAARAVGWGILRTTATPPKPPEKSEEKATAPPEATKKETTKPPDDPNEGTAQAETPATQVASETQAPPKAQKESALKSDNRRTNPPGVFSNNGTVSELPREDIHVAPDRFQFRSDASGKHGVTKKATADNDFDRDKAGPLAVWKDPKNGKVYVVDGHHRLQRANAAKYDKPLLVQYIDAETAEEARVKGELLNVKKGTVKPPEPPQ